MKTKKGYPIPQGCTVSGNTVNFSVAVPRDKKCELLLYKKGRRAPFTALPVKEDSVTGELRFLEVILDELCFVNPRTCKLYAITSCIGC